MKKKKIEFTDDFISFLDEKEEPKKEIIDEPIKSDESKESNSELGLIREMIKDQPVLNKDSEDDKSVVRSTILDRMKEVKSADKPVVIEKKLSDVMEEPKKEVIKPVAKSTAFDKMKTVKSDDRNMEEQKVTPVANKPEVKKPVATNSIVNRMNDIKKTPGPKITITSFPQERAAEIPKIELNEKNKKVEDINPNKPSYAELELKISQLQEINGKMLALIDSYQETLEEKNREIEALKAEIAGLESGELVPFSRKV